MGEQLQPNTKPGSSKRLFNSLPHRHCLIAKQSNQLERGVVVDEVIEGGGGRGWLPNWGCLILMNHQPQLRGTGAIETI